MYGTGKKSAAVFLLAFSILWVQPMRAAAATNPIKSVSIRVDSALEPGGSLSDIEIGSGKASDGMVRVSSGSSKYNVTAAEWVDKGMKELKAADEPRMKVTLEPEDVSGDYFLASYKKSSVKITSGTFVSARREGDNLVVTFRVKPVKGDFEPPVDAFWNENNLGQAKWEKPENTSGYYEVQLFRDRKSVFKVDKTTAVSYNFYPYMTKAGEYTFQVRTIPGTDFQKKYGGKSSWIESGELQITDRYVSDGKGQQKKGDKVIPGTKEKAGWNQEGSQWYYRYPDGSLCASRWENIEGHWYYFNGDASMATGWLDLDGSKYYLYSNGQMAAGWARIDGTWYFFRTEEENGHPGGSMAEAGWRVIGPYYYYFNEDGSLYTGWLYQGNKWYYLNTVDNSLQGAMFTGWINRDGKTYYADVNGALIEGWNQIDGNWYYFYPGTMEMARNTEIDSFYVNQDGIWEQ